MSFNCVTMSHSDRGGILVIVDPPQSLEFGIDCMEYETGPKFQGIVLIQEGLHFVYYSSGMGIREGTFLFFKKNELIVKMWDASNEELSSTKCLSEASFIQLQQSIATGQLDSGLGPYPVAQYGTWINISNLITKKTLERADISPGTTIYPGSSEDEVPRSSTEVMPYFSNSGRVARYSNPISIELKLQTKILQSQHDIHRAHQLSTLHIDQSEVLENLVLEYFDGNWEELLGELQLSFILFMMLYSHNSLQHWKKLVDMTCRSEKILLTHQIFSCTFIKILYEQLNFSPTDFFETELSKENFLRPSLTNLFTILNYNMLTNNDNNRYVLSPSLIEHKKRLFTFIKKKFNIFDDINDNNNVILSNMDLEYYNLVDDERPVIVQLSEHISDDEIHSSSNISNNTINQDYIQEYNNKINILSHSLDNSNINNCNYVTQNNQMMNTCLSAAVSDSAMDMDTSTSKLPELNERLDVRLNHIQVQEQMYCWRYPLVYDAMTMYNKEQVDKGFVSGCEDLTMTCMRILDSCDSKLNEKLVTEAIQFLEREVSTLGDINK